MKLVIVDLHDAHPLTEQALSLLPPDRCGELVRFSAEDRMRSAFTELAARRELLAFYPRVRELVFSRTEEGKPYLKELPDCFFSLSHSGEFAVCALSDAPVGVDVEQMRKRNFSAISSRFSKWEREQLAGAEGAEPLFYRFWTMRESVLKLCGRGLSKWKMVEITSSGVLFAGEPIPYEFGTYSLRQGTMQLLPFGEGDYVLSLCGNGEPKTEFLPAAQLLADYRA